jgi:excisionase family DNA binding protein
MNAATRSAVSTLLAADPSVKPDSIPLALAVLDGKANAPSPNGQPAQQEFLTVQEACALLRVSRATLFREEQDGRIHSVQIRGRKLFERVELINALRRGKGRE